MEWTLHKRRFSSLSWLIYTADDYSLYHNSTMAEIKSDVQLAEQSAENDSEKIHATSQGPVTGFTASQSTLPKGYYHSSYFLGSLFAVGIGLYAGVAGYGLLAPVLGIVNQDIGPDANIIWVALAYSLVLSVGFTLFGKTSDTFCRLCTYIFVQGHYLIFLGGVGAVLGARALVCSVPLSAPPHRASINLSLHPPSSDWQPQPKYLNTSHLESSYR